MKRKMQPRRPAAGSVCLWRYVVVLPLCVCLLPACSMRTARNQVLSVRASETERLRDLLSGKRIDASFADGTHLRGRVKEIQDGLLTVDIKNSTGSNPVVRGLQDISTDRISTVQFTRHKGKKRLLFTTLFFGGGFGLALGAVTELEDQPSRATATGIGVWSAMTTLGYLWGRKKDKKSVTLVIQQPDAPGGP